MKVHQYSLPSIKGDGWAEIMIREDGFFAAVSDYGDYAFFWKHHGKDDVRKFFIGKGGERNWEYCAGKFHLGRQKEYDGEETLRNARAVIAETIDLSDEQREAEEEMLEEYELLRCDADFHRWRECSDSLLSVEDRYGCWAERYPSDLQAFCKKTLARLSKAIEAELKGEAAESCVSGLTEEDHTRINADEDACRAAYFAAQDEK